MPPKADVHIPGILSSCSLTLENAMRVCALQTWVRAGFIGEQEQFRSLHSPVLILHNHSPWCQQSPAPSAKPAPLMPGPTVPRSPVRCSPIISSPLLLSAFCGTRSEAVIRRQAPRVGLRSSAAAPACAPGWSHRHPTGARRAPVRPTAAAAGGIAPRPRRADRNRQTRRARGVRDACGAAETLVALPRRLWRGRRGFSPDCQRQAGAATATVTARSSHESGRTSGGHEEPPRTTRNHRGPQLRADLRGPPGTTGDHRTDLRGRVSQRVSQHT